MAIPEDSFNQALGFYLLYLRLMRHVVIISILAVETIHPRLQGILVPRRPYRVGELVNPGAKVGKNFVRVSRCKERCVTIMQSCYSDWLTRM